MKKTDPNRLLRLIGTVAAFGLVVYLLSQQGWDEIIAGVRQIPAWRFAAAVLLMLVSRLAVAARWHTLLRSAAVPIPARQSLRITFAGLFASNFLPTTIGGDVVRLAMMLRLGHDRVIGAASLVVDRLVGMAGMASASAALLSFLGLGSISPSGSALLGTRLRKRGRRVLQRLAQATGLWVKSPKGLLLAFGFTWVHQLCLFGVNWLMLDGLGEDISFWLIGGLWSFTYFVTLLPISINGLGVQELSMTFIFSSLGGVSVQGAATAALLVRTLQMLASTPGAAFLSDILAGVKRREWGVENGE